MNSKCFEVGTLCHEAWHIERGKRGKLPGHRGGTEGWLEGTSEVRASLLGDLSLR